MERKRRRTNGDQIADLKTQERRAQALIDLREYLLKHRPALLKPQPPKTRLPARLRSASTPSPLADRASVTRRTITTPLAGSTRGSLGPTPPRARAKVRGSHDYRALRAG